MSNKPAPVPEQSAVRSTPASRQKKVLISSTTPSIRNAMPESPIYVAKPMRVGNSFPIVTTTEVSQVATSNVRR